jgi:hypothetical protein
MISFSRSVLEIRPLLWPISDLYLRSINIHEEIKRALTRKEERRKESFIPNASLVNDIPRHRFW